MQRPINGPRRVFLIRSSGMVTRVTDSKGREGLWRYQVDYETLRRVVTGNLISSNFPSMHSGAFSLRFHSRNRAALAIKQRERASPTRFRDHLGDLETFSRARNRFRFRVRDREPTFTEIESESRDYVART